MKDRHYLSKINVLSIDDMYYEPSKKDPSTYLSSKVLNYVRSKSSLTLPLIVF